MVSSLPDHIHRALTSFLSDAADLITPLVTVADTVGVKVLLVGGIVRDLLCDPLVLQKSFKDIDCVLQAPDLATTQQIITLLVPLLPESTYLLHREYGTGSITWKGTSLDLTAARAESYPHPAAAPVVRIGSLADDLFRRDFTCNALAVYLNGSQKLMLVDFYDGQRDLNAKIVSVLHEKSFIDDPTRIIRAIKFAVRLKFKIESRTIDLAKTAIKSNELSDARTSTHGVPSLGVRLYAELKALAEGPCLRRAYYLLHYLNALTLVHPDLRTSRQLRQRMIAARSFYKELGESWMDFMTAVVMSEIPAADHASTTSRLGISPRIRTAVEGWSLMNASHHDETSQSGARLLSEKLASEWSRYYERFSLLTLGLELVSLPRTKRAPLLAYIRTWRFIKSPLTGDELLKEGIISGKEVGITMRLLQDAARDSTVLSENDALLFVRNLKKGALRS